MQIKMDWNKKFSRLAALKSGEFTWQIWIRMLFSHGPIYGDESKDDNFFLITIIIIFVEILGCQATKLHSVIWLNY